MIRGTAPSRKIVSPLQQGDIMTLLQEVVRLAPQILSAHAEMKDLHKDVAGKIAQIKQGPPGPPGYSIQGRDGKDADHKAIAELLAAKVRMPRDGRPGKDGKSISPQDVAKFIIDKKLLKPEHIGGFKETIEGITKQLSGLQYGKDTWARGGGDTVSAGTGITITTDVNGKKIITNSGGLIILAATGTIDNSNTAFTFTSKPTIIYVNGTGYRENHGWTWNAGTLTATLANPVSTNGDIYGV